MTFYQLNQDMSVANIWCIGDISEVAENWQFDLLDRSPTPLSLNAQVAHQGTETDFSLGWRSFMFVSERARQAIKVAGVSDEEIVFHPISFDNYTPSQQYYALSIPNICACVDEERSDWSPSIYLEGETPMSRGFLRLYSSFFELVIDDTKAAGFDAFKLEGAQHIVVVSDKIMDAFTKANLTGAMFTKVS